MSRYLERPATEKNASWRLMAIFCLIYSGLTLTEQISNNVLPLTLHSLTGSAKIIGLILAINPAFGFIAQPLVGILSDRIWTPVGRRAFFLILGAPVVAVCLWFVPEARDLWQVVVLVIVYQFFQDVLWGSDHPLMADLIPPHQRTLVAGLLAMTAQIANFAFLRYGMNLFDAETLYRIVAIAQLVLVAGFAFFLGEKPIVSRERPKLTPWRYVRDLLGHPVRARFAALYFCIAVFTNIVGGFIVLFATVTLLGSKGEFGGQWSVQSLVILFLAIPASIAVERYLPKQWALVAGFIFGMVACVLGWYAGSVGDLLLVAIIWGVTNTVISVTFKPFFTEYLPSHMIGQLSGALNICYAVGRTLALAAGGWIIEELGTEYRYIWLIALFFCVISAIVAATIRDDRYSLRKEEKRSDVDIDPHASEP